MTFIMAGGGTGGHVMPLIAVAKELVKLGHEPIFVGTERGAESRLAPAAGFRLEKIRVGGLKGLGVLTRVLSVWRLLMETAAMMGRLSRWKPGGVFSLGGYVAGPPVLAALLRGIPVVVMEPNATPGATNKWISRWVRKALINFEETARFFPPARTERTGVPVRAEFFFLPPRPAGETFTVLITGGSQGSRTLNDAARAAWPLFRAAGLPVRLIHQTGTAMQPEMAEAFAKSGLSGSVDAFISDMPAAFTAADVIVARSGAGTTSELAAAGKPSILIPYPFAADDHQTANARAMEAAGAALVARDQDWTGQRFFDSICGLNEGRDRLAAMSVAARTMAFPNAARRAAEILLESVDKPSGSRNNK
jgi:UDP-N-acetylglucosamine--N-acetylmuramyl-(pentapeptide) pyrophosphoryl-undecaprenol N-acetylglucosamine transferase